MEPASQTVVHQTIEARKYGSPVTVPNTYSNVKIHTEKTYSLSGVPSNRIEKIVVRKQPRIHMPSSFLEPEANGSAHRQRFKRGRTHGNRGSHGGGEGDDDEESDQNQHVEDPEENGEYTAVEVVTEVDPSSPDGAFSDDTEVVFDTELKTSLPKFMVEKSEHEAIVDEFMGKI